MNYLGYTNTKKFFIVYQVSLPTRSLLPEKSLPRPRFSPEIANLCPRPSPRKGPFRVKSEARETPASSSQP